MNKLRTLLTWGLLSAAAHVMGYSLTVSPIEIEAGQSTNLIINLNNTETNLTAYQMKLFLPTGVTVQKKSNGKYAYTANADRHDGAFTFTVKDAADGSVLIAVFSADKDVIAGTSGELIRLPIDVASTVTTSLQGSLKEIEFTDVNTQAYKISDVNFTMTLKGGSTPPDVSGNVTVSVPDIEMTAGSTTNLIVNMQTDLTNLTAYQMKLFLPTGVTVQKKSNGKYAYTANADRHDGAFTFTVKDAADGSVLIAVFSADKDVIVGTSGELIRLPLEVASTVTTSLQGSLKEIEFTDVNTQAYTISDVNFTLTINEATEPNITFEDANVKAICVANWDTNGDGKLSEKEAAAVTNLGDVFKGNTTITSFDELQYFTGLDSIGYYAFGGCSSLASVKIPNSVTNIGEYAFENCSSLTSITIPKSVTSIGDFAFSYCSGLASMVVESGNPKYDSRDNCNAIIETEKNDIRVGCKNTIIPNGIARIRKGAFCGCSGLTSIALPDGVTSIGYRTFADCSSLTAINIPEGVTSIGDWSFENCHSLKTVTIPSIPSIGKGAFSGCGSLSSITCYAEDVPVAGDHIFYNVMTSAVTLYVYEWVIEAYQNAPVWKDFIIKAISGGYVIDDSMTSFSIDKEETRSMVKFTHDFNGDWESLYLPFAIDYDAIKADFDLAEIDGVVQNDDNNDGVADITVLSIMGFRGQKTEPNTPYLIRAKNTGEQTIDFKNITVYPTTTASIDCSSTSTKYEFTGSYNTLNASSLTNRYIIQDGELVKGANSLAPCRWYMTATARNGAPLNLPVKICIMLVEDVITGVSPLLTSPEEEGQVYNLAGQRLSKPQKGINIKNGKKYLVK